MLIIAIKFQSYNSSIKTFLHGDTEFDSKHFNPTIVRLKPYHRNTHFKQNASFQSYNSSIKTVVCIPLF